MSISYDQEQQVFHLQAGEMSYGFQIFRGHLAQLYWGRKVKSMQSGQLLRTGKDRAFSPNPEPADRSYSLDWLPQEFPSYGNTDFRQPAVQVQAGDGSTISDLRYESHQIINGKPQLEGLPSTYVEQEHEAQTLEVTLSDSVTGLKAILSYTVYERWNVLTRSVRFANEGSQSVRLLRAFSMSVDFPHRDYELLQLSGAWSRERYVEKRPLTPGTLSIESRRGGSSHQHNPFIALLDKHAAEDHGDVYGFSLVYSGNFAASVEIDQYDTTRVGIGINPFDFSWLLQPGETFQTPEAVMVYSPNGLQGMSHTYHELYRTRLCRGKFRDESRPVLINNWEATYFDFSADKIEQIAKAGKSTGHRAVCAG